MAKATIPTTANLGFEVKQSAGVKAVVRKVEIGHNLYDRSGSLE